MGEFILDSPDRISEIRAFIECKPLLKLFYGEIYRRYASCLERCPENGAALELGSGGGFARKFIPELIISDILPYQGVDLVVDGTMLPFANGSLRFICMTNVFHHIPDTELFLREAERCLVVGGRLLIVDQHPGIIAVPILKYLHHEPYNPHAAAWRFSTTGPLTGANGALPWIVFIRDRTKLNQLVPSLSLVGYRPHTPLIYWLSGGLRPWNPLPRCFTGLARALDGLLLHCSARFGSFVDIELVKT